MILVSQNKKTIISFNEIQMLQVCGKTVVGATTGTKNLYVIRLYPTLNDYFETKNGKSKHIEMAEYTSEEQAISAIEQVISYMCTNSIFSFPPDKSIKLTESITAINKYSDTSYL